jgi:DNA adenine methylase
MNGAAELSPPLKWAGGKRWLLPRLRELWDGYERRRLVEPFAGGLAVTLALAPRAALVNDVNEHLISFYRWLQRGCDLRSCGVPFRHDRATYDRNRKRYNALIAQGKGDSLEAAALLLFLNKSGFNGLYRLNRSGFFNVPFGRYSSVSYPSDFSAYREAFVRYDFRTGDFETLRVRRSDFIYADPPYDAAFTSYAADGFTWDDQVRLAEWLAKHSGPVVASNHATPRIMRLYRKHGFTVKKVAAPRRIACNGNREDALEMLAWRNL